MQRVSQAEIAARAGVSEATVSRVLNGKPGVGQATREAVLAALDVSGYQRPAHARVRTTGLVGLIIPELSNPVFPAFAQAVETALVRHGYAPVLCTLTAGGVHEDDYVALLLQRGVAGIVFVSGIHAVAGTPPDRYTALRERGLPIVMVNGYLPGVDAPFVSNDDAEAVNLAVEHLADLGHQRIGLAIGPPRYTTAARRISGFHAAIRHHLPGRLASDDVDDLIVTTSYRIEGGAAAAQTLIERGATGIVCGSDVMALGAIRAIRDRGLQVPQDISVIGSDDGFVPEFTDPPLTTIRQPVDAMGTAAVQALVHEIHGTPAPRAEILFRPDLVVRKSTAKASPTQIMGSSAPSTAEV
jgi:DNA-binding LacI/PurR family transcriptional regulator